MHKNVGVRLNMYKAVLLIAVDGGAAGRLPETEAIRHESAGIGAFAKLSMSIEEEKEYIHGSLVFYKLCRLNVMKETYKTRKGDKVSVVFKVPV